jgi:hypothetical protein
MSMLSTWVKRRFGAGDRGLDKTAQNSPCTLVVTHAELSARHGTGAILVRILRSEKNLIAFYSREFFKTHDIEVNAFKIEHPRNRLGAGRLQIRKSLKDTRVTRILCVPFYEDDVRSALEAHARTRAPLGLYIMDDQNIHVKEISDSLMRRLIGKASVCFAISPALCTAYEEKYKRKFWFVPPVADPDHFVPSSFRFVPNSPPRGILIGNLWSSHTLGQFRETIRLSGLKIDWYGNAGKPFINLDAHALSEEGILLHSHVPEQALIESARTADFAVIPSGTLDGSDSHDWLARASLPSRIVYLMAVANVPMIVMGHTETAAAHFVRDLRLGRVCDYSADSFRSAVKMVTEPSASSEIRAQANELSSTFSSRGLSTWLWDSITAGHPIDDRFNHLLSSKRTAEFAFSEPGLKGSAKPGTIAKK